jgi:AcrR family transcriptional regulator
VVLGRPARRGEGLAAIHIAAREAFAEQGFHATSVRDIARRSGVSMAALYHHYASKQELLFAVLQEAAEDYFSICEGAVADAADDPTTKLEALVRATVRYRVRHRIDSSLSLLELRNLEPRYRKLLEAREHAADRMWADIIAGGVAAGAFTAPWPDEARRAIIAICNAVADWYQPEGTVTVEELADRYKCLALLLLQARSPV